MRTKTPDPDQQWFDIVKFQHGKPGREIVESIQGDARAVHRVDVLDARLSPEEKAAGWDYYRTDGHRPSLSRRRGPKAPPDRRVRRRR